MDGFIIGAGDNSVHGGGIFGSKIKYVPDLDTPRNHQILPERLFYFRIALFIRRSVVFRQ